MNMFRYASVLNLSKFLLLYSIIAAVDAQAGSVSYPANNFATPETLTADKLNLMFNDIRTSVNSNDTGKQNKVNDSCTATQSIQSIADDGTATCVDLPTPGSAYTDQMARDAMGLKDNAGAGNPYNHDRFDPGLKNNVGAGNPYNHDRFDPGVKNNVGLGNPLNHDRFDPGVKNNVGVGNPYNHDRFDPGAKNNVGVGNPYNHDRFDPGAKNNIGIGNPLNHDRYTDADAVTAIKAADGTGSGLDADTLDGLDSTSFVQGNQGCSSGTMVGINNTGAIVCQISSSVATATLASSAVFNTGGTAYADVTSLVVGTPQPGAVHIVASGLVQVSGKLAAQYSSVYIGLSGTLNGTPGSGDYTRFFLSNEVPAGTYEIPFTVQTVVSAGAATSYTVHLVAENNGISGTVTLFQTRVVATYHKN